MSTILKALRRLEEEGAGKTRRELREEVATPGRTRSGPPSWPRWLLAGCGLVIFAVGVGLVGSLWLGPGEPAESPQAQRAGRYSAAPPAAAPQGIDVAARLPEASVADRATRTWPEPLVLGEATAPPGAAPAQTLARTSGQQPSTSAPQVEAASTPSFASGPQRLDGRAPEEATEAAPTSSARAALELEYRASLAADLHPAPVPSAPPRLAPAPARSAADSQAASRELAALESTPEIPVSAASDASEASPVVLRSQLPAMSIRSTRWHPESAQRGAEVELVGQGRVVHLSEGDWLGPLIVKKITPSGVVFDHGGVEVQQRVGERERTP